MSRRDAVLLMSRGATHRNNDPSQPSTLQAAWRTRRAAVADSTIGDGVAQVRGTRASDIIKTWATF